MTAANTLRITSGTLPPQGPDGQYRDRIQMAGVLYRLAAADTVGFIDRNGHAQPAGVGQFFQDRPDLIDELNVEVDASEPAGQQALIETVARYMQASPTNVEWWGLGRRGRNKWAVMGFAVGSWSEYDPEPEEYLDYNLIVPAFVGGGTEVHPFKIDHLLLRTLKSVAELLTTAYNPDVASSSYKLVRQEDDDQPSTTEGQ